jgi:hypothetical protein
MAEIIFKASHATFNPTAVEDEILCLGRPLLRVSPAICPKKHFLKLGGSPKSS